MESDDSSVCTSACSWSDLSLTEEWEYGPQYAFGDVHASDADDERECHDSVDSHMEDIVRRMLDFVFDED